MPLGRCAPRGPGRAAPLPPAARAAAPLSPRRRGRRPPAPGAASAALGRAPGAGAGHRPLRSWPRRRRGCGRRLVVTPHRPRHFQRLKDDSGVRDPRRHEQSVGFVHHGGLAHAHRDCDRLQHLRTVLPCDVLIVAVTHPLQGQRLRALSFHRRGGDLQLVVVLPDGTPGMLAASATDIFGLPLTRQDGSTALSVEGIRRLHAALQIRTGRMTTQDSRAASTETIAGPVRVGPPADARRSNTDRLTSPDPGQRIREVSLANSQDSGTYTAGAAASFGACRETMGHLARTHPGGGAVAAGSADRQGRVGGWREGR